MAHGPWLGLLAHPASRSRSFRVSISLRTVLHMAMQRRRSGRGRRPAAELGNAFFFWSALPAYCTPRRKADRVHTDRGTVRPPCQRSQRGG